MHLIRRPAASFPVPYGQRCCVKVWARVRQFPEQTDDTVYDDSYWESGRCAAHHAHFRHQLTVVKLWMSLGGNVGRDSRKIVIPHEHFAPCTVGAALLARCVERGTHGK